MSPKLSVLSDEELLDRFNSGEAPAFEVLLLRYRRPLFNFILRSVGERTLAEDLLQNVFLKVIQRSEEFRGQSKLSTWLYTIARNQCIDHSRRMVHRRHRSLDAATGTDGEGAPLVDRVANTAPGVDRDATSNELREKIAVAVELLPTDQREVFLLRQIEGMPFKEIADIVGVPENTVKSRMRYALERLQAALAEYRDHAHELK